MFVSFHQPYLEESKDILTQDGIKCSAGWNTLFKRMQNFAILAVCSIQIIVGLMKYLHELGFWTGNTQVGRMGFKIVMTNALQSYTSNDSLVTV